MRTKIICTIGPACDSEDSLRKLIQAGMSAARINCSHGSIESNEATIERVKKVRKEMGMAVAIMLDTKGPDIRVGAFQGGFAMLEEGQNFTLTTKSCGLGDNTRVSITYKKLPKLVTAGQVLLLNDGFVKLVVSAANDTEIVTRVVTGGRLSDRKTLFVPGVALGMPFLSKADELDLVMAVKTNVDYIAASFVNCKKDIVDMRKFLAKCGGEHIPIIAKIESREGVANIDDILQEADGIMVARGDLGVEYSIEQIPTVQKMLISKAVNASRLVITATEMLESMIEKPRPTRAESTDVANAIYDGTSAIMLSGETAVGKFPVQTVVCMRKIAEEAEANIKFDARFYTNSVVVSTQKEAFAKTITSASICAKAKAICVFTQSGGTAIRVSKFYPTCKIYAFARFEDLFHSLSLYNNVIPIFEPSVLTVNQMLRISNDYILDKKIASKGETIVVNASFQDSDTDLVLIHPLA